jgi:hypothetical protein
VFQPAACEVEQEVFPGLLALAVAIPEAHEFFVLLRGRANDDEEAMPRFLHACCKVHTIDPERNIPFAREAAALLLRQFLMPALFQPTDRRGGDRAFS